MMRTLCYFVIALCWSPLYGLDSFTILDQHPHIVITKSPAYSSEAHSPSDAYENFQHNHFQQLPKQARSFGFLDEPIWIGIELQNGCSQELFLNLANLSLDHIEYFIYQKGKLLQQGITGAMMPIKERSIKTFDLHIPVLEINEPLVYLLKIRSLNALIVPMTLGTEGALQRFVLPEIIAVSIFAGAFLALFLYNCILFMATKERDYLLYSLYIFSLFCLILSMREYFLPFFQDHLYLRNALRVIIMQAGTLFFILFALSFLNIKELSVTLYRNTLFIVAVIFLLFGTMPLGAMGHYVAMGALVCTMLTSLGIGILAKFHKNPLANYFLISIAAFFIGGSITICMVVGIIDYSFSAFIPLLIGSMLEMILFSLALGYKIRHLSLEHTKALTQLQTQNKILFLQSRYTSVGELIRNIAHQWKEPLGSLGAIQSNLKSTLVFQGHVSNEKLLNAIELSHGIINHLSRTIDTFYRFFKYKTDTKEEFNIVEEIENIQKIIKYSMDTDHIELRFAEQEDMTIVGNKNEFAHALLNIIINAKDVLVARNIANPTISIHTYQINNDNIIEIKDNAGGIYEQPIEKIFEPCISSKEEGIGIGLFITKTIVEKKFGGMLSVKNSDKGAVFKISLPIIDTETSENIDTIDVISEPALQRITRLERELSIKNEIEKTLKQWQNIFSQAHWAILLHSGTSNTFEMVNPTFKTMYKYTEKDIKTLSVADLFAPSNLNLLEQNQTEAFNKGFASFESIHRKKDGTEFPVSIDLTVIKNDEGEILYHIVNIRDITERKAAEKNLLLKEFALNKINEAVYLIDENSMFHYVNDGACRALGYSKEELSSMGVVDIDPNCPIAWWKSHWEDIKKLGTTLGVSQHRRKDGTLFAIEVSSNYFEYNDSEYSLAIVRDITERILLEEKKEDARMRLFFEKQLIGMAISSPEKNWLKVNDKLCTMFGYTQEELSHKTWSELTYPEDSDPDMMQFERVLKGEIEGYSIQKRFIRQDGGILYTNLSTTCIRKEDGRASYFLTLIEDITEQTCAHEALAKKEQELRSLAESSPGMMGSFCLRADGSMYMPYVSPNIVDLFGLLPKEVQQDATSLLALSHPTDAQRIHESIRKSAEEMSVWHEEYRIIHPLRGERWMESNTKPERNVNGDITWYGYVHDITERKKSELILDETRQRLHCVIQSIPDPVWMKDVNGVFVACNHGIVRLFNTKEEDIIGKDDYDFFEPELAEFYRNKDRSAVEADDARINEELWTFRDNGEQALMETRKVPVKSEDGTLLGVIGVARDITERKRIEEKLKENKAHLLAIISTIPDKIWLKDINGIYLMCNSAYEKFLGVPQDKIIGKTDYDFVSKEQSDFFRQKDLEALHAKTICINEEDIFQNNGQYAFLETRKVPVYNDHVLVGILGIGRDITERKQMEQELADSYHFLNHLIDSIPDPVFVKNRQHNWLLLNKAFCQFIGKQRNELLGKSDYDFFPKEEADVFWAKDEIVFETRMVNVNEEFFTTDSGNTYYIQTVKSMFVSTKGDEYLVGTIRNITEQKEAENTIKELNMTLEKKVRERTSQLQHALEFNEEIINAIPDLLFEIDAKGNYLNVWAQNEQLLSAHKKILLTHNVHDVLSFEAANTTMNALFEASQKGFSFGHVIGIDLVEGKRWFEFSVSKKALNDTFLVLSRDITDRKMTEKQLKLLEAAINKADNAIYIITRDSTIVYANDTALRMLGYEQNELIGMKIHDIDGQLETDTTANDKAMGKTMTFSTKHKTKDERILDVQVTATYFKFNDVNFGIALVKDITKQAHKGYLADE